MSACLGPPVDIGTCVQRTVQDIQHAPMAEANPLQFPSTRSAPMPCGKAQLMFGEVAHHRQCRGVLLEEGEDQVNSFLNGFIGIKDGFAYRIVDQSAWQAEAQLSLFSFGQFATLQSAFEPMEFCFTHCALEAQQESVIVRSGIVDALLINDQRIGESTNLQQMIPITA